MTLMMSPTFHLELQNSRRMQLLGEVLGLAMSLANHRILLLQLLLLLPVAVVLEVAFQAAAGSSGLGAICIPSGRLVLACPSLRLVLACPSCQEVLACPCCQEVLA